MKETQKPTMSITEVMNQARSNFKKEYGRLLTDEEVIEWTNEARKHIRAQKEENRNQNKN